MARDAETFRTKLGGVEGCGNAGEVVMDAVRSKALATTSTATATTATTTTAATEEDRSETPLGKNVPIPLMNGN